MQKKKKKNENRFRYFALLKMSDLTKLKFQLHFQGRKLDVYHSSLILIFFFFFIFSFFLLYLVIIYRPYRYKKLYLCIVLAL